MQADQPLRNKRKRDLFWCAAMTEFMTKHLRAALVKEGMSEAEFAKWFDIFEKIAAKAADALASVQRVSYDPTKHYPIQNALDGIKGIMLAGKMLTPAIDL